MPRVLAAVIVLAAVAAALVIVLSSSSSGAAQPRAIESIFQDDDHLIYASTATVTNTLDELKGLGVDRIRATVLWRAIAPDPTGTAPPPRFDPSNPAAYPASSWAPYDRLVELAGARGIALDFNVGAPGPLWAMGRGSPSPRYADHWMPSAAQFGAFVTAVGRRYSGTYAPPGGPALPRVSYWSVWNEPNQPGWLAPQWATVQGQHVIESAVLYRAYVDAAFAALERTGHGPGSDTILVGELAPEGSEAPSDVYSEAIPPMPFLRALYCVDPSYRPLTGAAAAVLGCPPSGGGSSFVSAHPGLFDATGFAHHPYSFFLAPSAQMSDVNFVPLIDLGRLEHGLDSIFATYGVGRRLPLYLTEYGYETNPPNPFRGVSLATQALYLNEAEYMAWQNPRVRAMSQFLLYDALPDARYPRGSVRYWETFQTGLRYANGAAKPSLDAYRLPIFVADPVLGSGGAVNVWGRLRPAADGGAPRAQLQWAAPGGSYRTLATVTASQPSDVLSTRLTVPGPGTIRLAWTASSGQTYYSRPVGLQAH
ncbi:MAG TPA: hypothetical protein VMP89_06220 [Solirubrobacteraceae bacterium]|nr:hypothetical protein [Solirubrobacteraceae bacterium]